MCSTLWAMDLVKAVGRQDGEWRFQAEDAIDARSRALRPDILCLASDEALCTRICWPKYLPEAPRSPIGRCVAEGRAMGMAAMHALRGLAQLDRRSYSSLTIHRSPFGSQRGGHSRDTCCRLSHARSSELVFGLNVSHSMVITF